MSDSFDLRRFVDAQAAVYPQIVAELSHGRKQTHWMWFIFLRSPASASAPWRNASQSAPAPRPSHI